MKMGNIAVATVPCSNQPLYFLLANNLSKLPKILLAAQEKGEWL